MIWEALAHEFFSTMIDKLNPPSYAGENGINSSVEDGESLPWYNGSGVESQYQENQGRHPRTDENSLSHTR